MDVTNEGREKIELWLATKKTTEAAKRKLSMAQTEEKNAHNNLGKWLMPNDAKVGEKFAVWYGSEMIEVQVTDTDPILRIRKRNKS